MTLLLPPQSANDTHGYDITIAPDLAGDRQVWVASHPELPGCMAHGDSPYEAVSSLREARELYLASLERRGLPFPPSHPDPRVVTAQIVEINTLAASSQTVIRWS